MTLMRQRLRKPSSLWTRTMMGVYSRQHPGVVSALSSSTLIACIVRTDACSFLFGRDNPHLQIVVTKCIDWAAGSSALRSLLSGHRPRCVAHSQLSHIEQCPSLDAHKLALLKLRIGLFVGSTVVEPVEVILHGIRECFPPALGIQVCCARCCRVLMFVWFHAAGPREGAR